MSLYRHQRYWDPCRRGSFSSGSWYGGSGQRICYYPSYGRSYCPPFYYGGYGYGRGYYPPQYSGGYGRGYYPPQYYGGSGYRGLYGRRSSCYGLGYGSRRGSICYDPCGYSSAKCYPLSRRYSCSSISGYGYGRGYYPPQYYGGSGYGGLYGRRSSCYGLGYGSKRGSICYDPCGYSSAKCYPLSRRYSCSSIKGPC